MTVADYQHNAFKTLHIRMIMDAVDAVFPPTEALLIPMRDDELN